MVKGIPVAEPEPSPAVRPRRRRLIIIALSVVVVLLVVGLSAYVGQRALAAKSIDEAQKGVLFAAALKLIMPVIIGPCIFVMASM